MAKQNTEKSMIEYESKVGSFVIFTLKITTKYESSRKLFKVSIGGLVTDFADYFTVVNKVSESRVLTPEIKSIVLKSLKEINEEHYGSDHQNNHIKSS